MAHRPSDRGGPMGPREDVRPTGRGGRGVQVVAEPNLNECGAKRAHTVEGNSLGAQRGRCDLLVGVNCNSPLQEYGGSCGKV